MATPEAPSHQWEHPKDKITLSELEILKIDAQNILNRLRGQLLTKHDSWLNKLLHVQDLLNVNHDTEKRIFSEPRNLTFSVDTTDTKNYTLMLMENHPTDGYSIGYSLRDKTKEDLWNSLSEDAVKTLHKYADIRYEEIIKSRWLHDHDDDDGPGYSSY